MQKEKFWFVEVEPKDNFANQTIVQLISKDGIEIVENLGRMEYLDHEGKERGFYKVNEDDMKKIAKAISDGTIKAKLIKESEVKALRN